MVPDLSSRWYSSISQSSQSFGSRFFALLKFRVRPSGVWFGLLSMSRGAAESMAAAIEDLPLGIQFTHLALEISEQGVYSKTLEWVGWLYWFESNIL